MPKRHPKRDSFVIDSESFLMLRLLVWNGSSGKSTANLHVLAEAYRNDATQVCKVTRGVDLAIQISQAVADGCEVVLAAGGDGTVNAVVNALMPIDASRRPRLAILPLGTANDFAATLFSLCENRYVDPVAAHRPSAGSHSTWLRPPRLAP